ncbi:restriction endonuclease subunit S [Clostridiales bacterium FE2011]|nr:restriction endonuclease subunit S [Clostridiales bacterium FE2011]
MRNLTFVDCVDVVGTACPPFPGTKKYVSTGAIDIDHIVDADTETVDYAGRPSRANLVAVAGDVLFAKMQGTKKTLLVTDALAESIYSTGFCAVRPKKGILTERCLYHLLTSQMFLAQKDKHCSGATQKAITNAGLEKIVINVPNIEEQETIADLLDAINRIISQRQRQLRALDSLIKARFVEMFGDIILNPYGYKKEKLKLTCNIVTGNTPSRSVPEHYGHHIEWIKTDNIVAGQLHPTKATESLSEEGMRVGRTVDSGSILMACIAGSIASIGRVCVTDRTVSFNQQINAIIPESYNTLFLYVMLQLSKEYLVEDISMALKGILSKSKLEDKEFIVPPIEQQEHFADFVSQVDKSKVIVQKALEETQMMFDSLMQDYFG